MAIWLNAIQFVNTKAFDRHDFSITVSVLVIKSGHKFFSLSVCVVRRVCGENVRFKPRHNTSVVRDGESEHKNRSELVLLALSHVYF